MSTHDINGRPTDPDTHTRRVFAAETHNTIKPVYTYLVNVDIPSAPLGAHEALSAYHGFSGSGTPPAALIDAHQRMYMVCAERLVVHVFADGHRTVELPSLCHYVACRALEEWHQREDGSAFSFGLCKLHDREVSDTTARAFARRASTKHKGLP